MALHYQVYADFVFIKGKPQLASTSIFSTSSAVTSWVEKVESAALSITRIFPTLQNAHNYIAYLHGVYKDSPATPPVLDSGQKEFF